jgi:hypothetical protein
MKNRGEIATVVLVAVAVGALIALFIPKPKFLDSRSRDAQNSVEASQKVEFAVAKALEGEHKKAAEVSASVKVMGDAASEAGDSPWAVFVAREANHIAPLLPAPDYKALYAAEARKRAVLEGKLELADKLYKEDAQTKQKIIEKSTELQAKLDAAFEKRQELDQKLVEAAAYARGKDAVIGGLIFFLLIGALVFWWVKRSGVNLGDLAKAVADIKSGTDPVQALDRILSLRHQDQISRIVDPSK